MCALEQTAARSITQLIEAHVSMGVDGRDGGGGGGLAGGRRSGMSPDDDADAVALYDDGQWGINDAEVTHSCGVWPLACWEETLEDYRGDDDGRGALYNPVRRRSSRPDDTLESLLRRCHELLIAPVATHLEERLIVVPDQQLFALPFAALCDADGCSLLERHTIRVSPSIGVLRSRRTTHRAAARRRRDARGGRDGDGARATIAL